MGVAPKAPRCYTRSVPTTQPRYTITDTGDTRAMLDLAERRWPDVDDRRLLLLKLAAAGHEAIAAEVAASEGDAARELQHAALARAAELIDVEELLDDAAWR